MLRPFQFLRSFAPFLIVFSLRAFGAEVSQIGPVALIEWNPADLRNQSVSIRGEYLLIDGIAFGGHVRVTDKEVENFEKAGVMFGGNVTQYLADVSLRGPFLRAEINLFGDQFSARQGDLQESGYVYGATVGGVLGYRYEFSQRIIGSAGYGFVRNLPDFFGTGSSTSNQLYRSDLGEWEFDILASVGVSL